jgi:hypothetical protein
MAKGTPAQFADAKRRALRALAQQQPDGFVPDRVMFFNDDLGFIFRLSNLSDDHHAQRIVMWAEVEQARVPIIEEWVSRTVEMLARSQGEAV